jgi:hypothetical protein
VRRFTCAVHVHVHEPSVRKIQQRPPIACAISGVSAPAITSNSA